MPLPTVTAKDLHASKLAPALIRMLHQRAVRANRREYAPQLAADRAGLAEIQGEYANAGDAARGQVALTENVLATQLKNLSGSGLKGPYLGEVAKEIARRQGQTAQSLPFLLAAANEGKGEALREGRQELRQDVASQQSETASEFSTLLEGAHSDAQTFLEEEEDRQKAALKVKREKELEVEHPGSKYDKTNLQNAKLFLKATLGEWAKNEPIPGAEDENGDPLTPKGDNPLRTPEDWLRLAKQMVEAGEGFGLAEANFIIQKYLKGVKRRATEAAGASYLGPGKQGF